MEEVYLEPNFTAKVVGESLDRCMKISIKKSKNQIIEESGPEYYGK